VKVTIIYENMPFSDRKWVRIIKTDDGRIVSRTRHYTKEAAEQGEGSAEDNAEDGAA
jgi:hypothetical protein